MREKERGSEAMPEFTVFVVAEHGLGFGEGSIGVNNRLAGETKYPLDQEVLDRVDAAINSPEILVPVDVDDSGEPVDDDGCSDGRGVKVVMQGTEIKKRSLNRSKVFGAGLTMGVASRIGTGEAKGRLEQEFENEINEFAEREINFGAHTDEHAYGDKCGCGAIDNAPLIIAKTVVYRKEIEQAVSLLSGIPNEQNKALKTVLDNFESYAQLIIGQDYKGANVMKKIIDRGKIVKQLEGEHLEARLLINKKRGYTPNQELVRRISGGKVQLFGVDEWHIEDLSKKLYDNEQQQLEAYMSMLVYTLATSGVLTKGDIKVFVAMSNKQFVVAA